MTREFTGLYNLRGELVFPISERPKSVYVVRLCPNVGDINIINSNLIHSQNGFLVRKDTLRKTKKVPVSSLSKNMKKLYQLRKTQSQIARPISCPIGCNCLKKGGAAPPKPLC